MVDFKLSDVVLRKAVDVIAHKVSQKRKLAAQFGFMEPYTNYKSAAVHPCGDGHRYRTHQNATPVPVSVSVVVLPSVMTPYNGKMGYLLTLCLVKLALSIFAKSN